MSDAARQTLSIATIAICCVVAIPCLISGTQSYDSILQTQKQLLQGQQASHDDFVALSKRIDGHDVKLAQLQNTMDESLAKNAAVSARDKRYQDKANN